MTLRDSFRIWRRRLKALLPYVRRRQHVKLQSKYTSLARAIGWASSPASSAALQTRKTASELSGDVCFFVTYAASPTLKAHVRDHIEHMLKCGVKVVLVANTDLPLDAIEIESDLLARLSGAYVRENQGYDFAAWGHLFQVCGPATQWTRLFVVNDSVVGPLSSEDFVRMIDRVRASSADVIGLTENLHPRAHLQSYFLVFNAPALAHAAVISLFSRMINLPDKSFVIDVYETHLTEVLESHGLRCEALFPALQTSVFDPNDTYLRWDTLLQKGFPFVKTSVIKEFPDDARVRTLVPEAYRRSAL